MTEPRMTRPTEQEESASRRRSKRPGMAALLSLVVPGLGQAWLGAFGRGLLFAAPLLIVAGAAALFAVADPKQTLDALVHPSFILALLVVNVGLALWHLAAIQDAYRLGRRRLPSLVGRPSALRSPLLILAIVVAVAGYGAVEVVGVHAYGAAEAIFDHGQTGFTIPSASFAPHPTRTPGATMNGETQPPATPTADPTQPLPAWAADGRLNLLLVGSDAGPGRWLARTDTMIVLSVDVATGHSALFGIPRNIANVPLPPESAKAFKGGRYPDFLNSLYVYAMQHPALFPGGDAAGFRAVTGAVQELVGQPLDGVIVVNLNGFVDLVDAIGGLWVNVPSAVYDSHYPKPDGSGYIQIYIKPGCQKLDGIHALEYARSRHQSDDYARMRRQQIVLASLAHQLDPIAMLPQVPHLLDVARDNLWTTITPDDIGALAALAAKARTSEIAHVEFSPPDYPEYLTTAEINHIQDTFASVFDNAPKASPTPSAPAPSCPAK